MSQLLTETGQPIEKVMVAVPCGDQVAQGFALDFALLAAYTTFARPDCQLSPYFLTGTYLPRARNLLATKALELCASHILWLDSDMRFPKDTLIRLLAHQKPIVAANYVMRSQPILPIALDEQRQPVFDKADDVLQEVSCAPMGVMLTETAVFTKMPKPWFAVGYNASIDDYAAEDLFFCKEARRHDYAIWIDPALSEQVRHVGSVEYAMQHGRMTRDLALAQRQETAETF